MTPFLANLYVIAAPSGTGKTTLVRAVAESMANVVVSISYTTRAKRPEETEGVNYYFVDNATFENMIAEQAFIEYATVFDHFYGTSKQWVEAQLLQHKDVILEIDWQGYQQIKALFETAIGIFILPPSLAALSERLYNRNHGEGHQALVAKRLIDVKEAVSHIHEFDYVLVNSDLRSALVQLQAIIMANHLLKEKQCARYADLIASMSQ